MAKKAVSGKKASPKASASAKKSDDNVVRIKASASAPKKDKPTKKTVEAEVIETKVDSAKQPKPQKDRKARKNVFAAIGGYFKGAWVELRQVRWPTRKATWSLTGAVLLYTLFFVVLILLLDAGFKFLFEIILGK